MEDDFWKYVEEAAGVVSDPRAMVALLFLAMGGVILWWIGPWAWAQIFPGGSNHPRPPSIPRAERIDTLALRNQVDAQAFRIQTLEQVVKEFRRVSHTASDSTQAGDDATVRLAKMERDVQKLRTAVDIIFTRIDSGPASEQAPVGRGVLGAPLASHHSLSSAVVDRPRNVASPVSPPLDLWPTTTRDLIQAWSQSMIDGRLDDGRFQAKAGAVPGVQSTRRQGKFAIVEFTHGGTTRQFAVPTRSEGYQAREYYDCTDDDRDATIEAIAELAVCSDSTWSRGRVRTRKSG